MLFWYEMIWYAAFKFNLHFKQIRIQSNPLNSFSIPGAAAADGPVGIFVCLRGAEERKEKTVKDNFK